MREYGKIFTEFWPQTSGLTDDVKLFLAYLHTCPHGNLIGCFRLPKEYAASDLRWPLEKVSSVLAELKANPCETEGKPRPDAQITYDEASAWVLIHNFLRLNPLEHPTWVKSALKLIERIPQDGPIYQQLAAIIKENREHVPEPILTHLATQGQHKPNPGETEGYSGTGAGTGAAAVGKEGGALKGSAPPQQFSEEIIPQPKKKGDKI